MVLNYIFVGCLCLLGDRGVLLTKLAGTGITKSSWKCRPQNSRFFLSKSVKKSVKRGVRVLRAKRSSLTQPRSRPFVWLLERTSIGKNTDCFAVYWKWTQSYLSGRTQQVKLPGVLSRHGEVIAGVPQGGVVSQLRMSTILRTASPGNTCIHLQVRWWLHPTRTCL